MVEATPLHPDIRAAARRHSRQSGLNEVLFWGLSALLILAPLPLASNRPLPWGSWATCTGVMALAYLAILFLRGERLRVPLSALKAPGMLMGAMLLYLCVQLLPIPTTLALADQTVLAIARISIVPNMTLLMIVRQLTFAMLFLLVLQVCVNDGRRARFLHVLLLAILAYGLYAEIALQAGDTLLGVPKWAYAGAATGTFVNRNSFATFLAFGAILALAQIGGLLMRRSERHRDDGQVAGSTGRIVLYALAYIFLLILVVATQSRMGLVSLGVGSLAVLVLAGLHMERRLVFALALPLAVLAIAFAAILFGASFFARSEKLDVAADVRFSLYAETLHLIAQRPLTGFGGGSFEMAYPLVHTEAVDTNFIWDHAHNTYLTLWSELGLVFGTLPMLALGCIALVLFRGLRQRQGSFTGQLSALGVLTIGAVHSLFDFSLEIEANTFMFLAIIAAGLAPLAARTPSRSY